MGAEADAPVLMGSRRGVLVFQRSQEGFELVDVVSLDRFRHDINCPAGAYLNVSVARGGQLVAFVLATHVRKGEPGMSAVLLADRRTRRLHVVSRSRGQNPMCDPAVAVGPMTRGQEVQISPDGSQVAFQSRTLDLDIEGEPEPNIPWTFDLLASRVYVWDRLGGRIQRIDHIPFERGDASTDTLSWSPDSRFLAFASDSGALDPAAPPVTEGVGKRVGYVWDRQAPPGTALRRVVVPRGKDGETIGNPVQGFALPGGADCVYLAPGSSPFLDRPPYRIAVENPHRRSAWPPH